MLELLLLPGIPASTVHFLEDQVSPAKAVEIFSARTQDHSYHPKELTINVTLCAWAQNYQQVTRRYRLERKNNRVGMQDHTLHDEKNTGCCSLVSKAGMITEVRAVLKCGSPGKYLFSILSRPLPLYLGPLRALKFRRLSLNSPLVHNHQAHTQISS
jgi:hypothetical protein